MDYRIDIIDTVAITGTTIVEFSSANSIILSYEGADVLDNLKVVGSSLDFNIEVLFSDNVDAAHAELFTGDEQRFKVHVVRDTDNHVYWQGYLLPDSYSEPYERGTFYVDFQATDGLGRLRGKYLPDSYYENEHSVLDIVATCLKLTGLQLPLIFAPGIDNTIEKDWNNIYIDTSNYITKTKKQTAHKILETFLEDTLSTVYQHNGKWYIEGLNKRNILEYTAKEYDFNGNYISDITVIKPLKNIVTKALVTPNITMVPPYKLIEVAHSREPLALSESLYSLSDEQWVITGSIPSNVIANSWFGFSEFQANAKFPDYEVFLTGSNLPTLDTSKNIVLFEKIYVSKFQKLRFEIEATIQYFGEETAADIDTAIANSYWNKPLLYELTLNNVVVANNTNSFVQELQKLEFDKTKKAKLNFEFIAQEAGLIDLKLFQPYGLFNDTKVEAIVLNKVELNPIDFNDEEIFSDEIDSEHTINKEGSITFADDASGFSKAFRLAKLNRLNNSLLFVKQFPVQYTFSQEGRHFASVTLEAAFLIEANSGSVQYIPDATGVPNAINILSVEYNYLGGEQFLIETQSLLDAGVFAVSVKRLINYDLDRSSWLNWTDSVYVYENERFGQAYVSVLRRLFGDVLIKLDATVEHPVSFFDLLNFNFDGLKSFVPTRVSFNFDNGESTITATQSGYAIQNTLIPPVVILPDFVYLPNNATAILISGNSYDVDGVVVSRLWTKITGQADDVIESPTQDESNFTNLIGDEYQYQLTATDNDGLTGSDQVTVLRIRNHIINLLQVDYSFNDIAVNNSKYARYEFDMLVVLPIPSQEALNLTYSLQPQVFRSVSSAIAWSRIIVYKNGFELINQYLESTAVGQVQTEPLSGIINYVETDDITVVFEIFKEGNANAQANFQIQSAVFVNGYPGTIQAGATANQTRIVQ